MVINLVDKRADGVGGVVHVNAGRVGVLADGVELVTVLDGDVSEGLEVSFFNCFNNSVSPTSTKQTLKIVKLIIEAPTLVERSTPPCT